MKKLLAAFWALALLISAPAALPAQSMQLFPGPASSSGKANLAGGNSFTGDQTIAGNTTVTGATHNFGPTTGAAADLVLNINNTNTRSDLIGIAWSGGTPTVLGSVAFRSGLGTDYNVNNGSWWHRFQINGSDQVTITSTGLVAVGTVSGSNLLTSGLPASVATGTIIGRTTAGTGAASALTVLPTAVMPALTGDVTNSAGSLGTTIAAGAVTLAKQASFAASSLMGNPTGSGATPSAITLAGGLGFSGTTLTAAGALTPTSVASSGAISGTSIAGTTTILSSGATSGIGYATGAGGAQTQGTSRTTTVVNNKACGAITMFSAAGSATWATFTVTDSAVAATDVIVANQKSGTNLYMLAVTSIGAGTFNLSFATTGGTATDAPVINYCVIKGVAA